MRILAYLCFWAITANAWAEVPLPKGCHAVTVQGNSVSLQAKNNTLFFIHNLTKADLWITHPVSNPGASAGWASRLQSQNWSALLVDKGPFELTCIESRPGHEQQIACEGAVAVCNMKKGKIPSTAQGTFWVGEDKSLAALSADVGGRGFELPHAK